jgi:ribosomal protein S17
MKYDYFLLGLFTATILYVVILAVLNRLFPDVIPSSPYKVIKVEYNYSTEGYKYIYTVKSKKRQKLCRIMSNNNYSPGDLIIIQDYKHNVLKEALEPQPNC